MKKPMNVEEFQEIYNELLTLRADENEDDERTVYRPWGYYTCLYKGDCYLAKVISVASKQKLSVQSHNHRCEHWIVLEGNALVILNDKEYCLTPGESIDIALQEKHSLQNPYDTELKIMEIQKGDYLSEDDIVRYEDMYGRA